MYRPSPETLITGAITVAVVILVALLLATQAQAEPITGRASVIDGDTLEIRGIRVRLFGVDAPEAAQVCHGADGLPYRAGQRAGFALSDRIGSAPVSCMGDDRDHYGRLIAVCTLRGTDLNAWLVSQGHAIAYRRYSSVYVDEEAAAKRAGLGLWAGACDEPEAWRRSKRR